MYVEGFWQISQVSPFCKGLQNDAFRLWALSLDWMALVSRKCVKGRVSWLFRKAEWAFSFFIRARENLGAGEGCFWPRCAETCLSTSVKILHMYAYVCQEHCYNLIPFYRHREWGKRDPIICPYMRAHIIFLIAVIKYLTRNNLLHAVTCS